MILPGVYFLSTSTAHCFTLGLSQTALYLHPCFIPRPERTPLSPNLAFVPSVCSIMTSDSPLPPTPSLQHPAQHSGALSCSRLRQAQTHRMLGLPCAGEMGGRSRGKRVSSGPRCQRSELTASGGSRCGGTCPEPPGLITPYTSHSGQRDRETQRGIALCPRSHSQERRPA